jgi:AcrR family transcriptional regulator
MPLILKLEIKEKFLSAALDCFLEKSYRSASMQEIAGKAGIAMETSTTILITRKSCFPR